MSSKFNRVKRYFDAEYWTAEQVHNAVDKGWITAEEFEQITGRAYEDSAADAME